MRVEPGVDGSSGGASVAGRVNRFEDGWSPCFANVTLPGGKAVLISVARGKGVRVHRLWAFGRLPGRAVWAADWPKVQRAAAVLEQDIDAYPALSKDAEMGAFLDFAIGSIKAGASVEASPLKTFTRVALGSATPEMLARTLERASNTPPPARHPR